MLARPSARGESASADLSESSWETGAGEGEACRRPEVCGMSSASRLLDFKGNCELRGTSATAARATAASTVERSHIVIKRPTGSFIVVLLLAFANPGRSSRTAARLAANSGARSSGCLRADETAEPAGRREGR